MTHLIPMSVVGPQASELWPKEAGAPQQFLIKGHRHAYITHAHTHTLINQSTLYSALFGLFIWTQEKGGGW